MRDFGKIYFLNKVKWSKIERLIEKEVILKINI
jgi:hypothetical protein